jgi:hypothetical protein
MKLAILGVSTIAPMLAVGGTVASGELHIQVPSVGELIITGMLGVIGFLASRYIERTDANTDKQWEVLDNHETRLSHMEGEHKANHK